MKKYHHILYPALLVFVLIFHARAGDAADRYSMINVHPNQDLGHYFFVQESETLPQFKWSLGTMSLYYDQLLNTKFETIFTSPGGQTIRSETRRGIDHLVYQYFYGALGLADWASLMVDFPLFIYYQYGWATSTASSSDTYFFKPGDIWLSLKFRLLDLDKHPVGIALIPSLSIPTGKDSHFLGDEGVNGEAKIVIEVKPIEKFRIAFNAAVQSGERVAVNDVSFRNMIKFAVGANYEVVDNVSIIAEAESHTVTNDFYGARRTSPAEARLGAKWYPGGGPWSLGGGGSVGIIHGAGMPRYAGFLSVGYTSSRAVRKPEPPEVTPVSELDPLIALEQCYPLSPRDDDSGYRYRAVCTVYFGFDTTTTSDTDVISGIVDYVRRSSGPVYLEIRGWADPVGPLWYNQKLSLERARSVAASIEQALGDEQGKAAIRVLGIGEEHGTPHHVARRAETIIK